MKTVVFWLFIPSWLTYFGKRYVSGEFMIWLACITALMAGCLYDTWLNRTTRWRR